MKKIVAFLDGVTARQIGDRIVAASCKRPAPQQPPHGQPRAAARPVPRNCFVSILRTRGIKLAPARHQRRKRCLVDPYARKQNPHGRAF